MIKTKGFKTSLCLIMIILLSFSVTVFGQEETVEVKEEIKVAEWITKGWAKVHTDKEIDFEENITRVEFIALTNSLFELKDKGENIFDDIKENDIYYNEILKSIKAGMIVGQGNGQFEALSEISKAEAYVILSKVLQLDEVKETKLIKNFKDHEEIPNWAKAAVEGLSQKGMLVNKNKVKSDEKLTGKEAVELIETSYKLSGVETIDKIKEDIGKTKEEKEKSEEVKGGGNSKLNYIESYLVNIEDGVSNNVAKIEGEISFENGMYIKLVFDRGMVRDNWENNREQIKLVDKDGTEVEAKVIRIADSDDEKSSIFIEPLGELANGENYKILVAKDLKANNGNTLGEDLIIELIVK